MKNILKILKISHYFFVDPIFKKSFGYMKLTEFSLECLRKALFFNFPNQLQSALKKFTIDIQDI